MPPESSTPKWRLAFGVAIALVLLNGSLTFENVWPTPKIRWTNDLSIELIACVLLLAMAHRWARSLARSASARSLGGARGRTLSRRNSAGAVRPRVQSVLGLAASRQRDGDARARRADRGSSSRCARLSSPLVALMFIVVAPGSAGGWPSAMELPMARRALGVAATALLVIFGAQHVLAQPGGDRARSRSRLRLRTCARSASCSPCSVRAPWPAAWPDSRS